MSVALARHTDGALHCAITVPETSSTTVIDWGSPLGPTTYYNYPYALYHGASANNGATWTATQRYDGPRSNLFLSPGCLALDSSGAWRILVQEAINSYDAHIFFAGAGAFLHLFTDSTDTVIASSPQAASYYTDGIGFDPTGDPIDWPAGSLAFDADDNLSIGYVKHTYAGGPAVHLEVHVGDDVLPGDAYYSAPSVKATTHAYAAYVDWWSALQLRFSEYVDAAWANEIVCDVGYGYRARLCINPANGQIGILFGWTDNDYAAQEVRFALTASPRTFVTWL
jgi:hypothetical protein